MPSACSSTAHIKISSKNNALPDQQMVSLLFAAASPFFDNLDGCHGIDHTRRVHNLAIHLGRQASARLQIVSAAAILHDIGRRYETAEKGAICHARKGAELALPILRKFPFDDKEIEAITHCIRTHRFRDDSRPASLEAKILFDADKLDSIGATGIGRAFHFAGHIGAKLHNPACAVELSQAYSEEDTAYREFRLKLCKIKDAMLTHEGRQLALERHRFMEIFFARLNLECEGEWNQGAEKRTIFEESTNSSQ